MVKNSFITGAAVLMVANGVSKILGAVFKIPLTYIVHEEGMAVYNTAFSVYAMFLTFVISGIPFAVQKLTAESFAKNNTLRARAIISRASLILCVIGAVASALMWLGADFLALAMKEERAVGAIKMIAPSVFLTACVAGVKGGFQGRSNMLPTAASQVAEAAARLVIGYALAVFFIGMGTEVAATGAIAGATAGEGVASLLLAIWYFIWLPKLGKEGERGSGIVKEIMTIAVPMLSMSVITSAISMCDTSVLRSCLLKSGMTSEEARFAYGAYTGYAMTVLNLPSGFMATVGVSVIPVISGAKAVGNMERVRSVIRKGLFLTAAGSLFFCVCFAIWSEEVLYILFKNTYSANMLRCAVPSVFFVSIMQFSGAVLQASGRMGSSFLSVVTAVSLKLVITAVLAIRPEFNIYGSVLGSDIGYFVGAVMNLLFMARI